MLQHVLYMIEQIQIFHIQTVRISSLDLEHWAHNPGVPRLTLGFETTHLFWKFVLLVADDKDAGSAGHLLGAGGPRQLQVEATRSHLQL